MRTAEFSRPVRGVLGVLALLSALAVAPGVAHAQGPKGEPKKDAAAAASSEKDAGEKKQKGANEASPKVVEVQETGEEGVKTYKFGAVDVEGRLKAPQIIYFLRRVRAEFEAGLLGHRSFMRELSDTRRDPSLR
jgi:hypothetical protein